MGKIHGVPVARYMGRGTGGTGKHREELEAENERLKVPCDGWGGRRTSGVVTTRR